MGESATSSALGTGLGSRNQKQKNWDMCPGSDHPHRPSSYPGTLECPVLCPCLGTSCPNPACFVPSQTPTQRQWPHHCQLTCSALMIEPTLVPMKKKSLHRRRRWLPVRYFFFFRPACSDTPLLPLRDSAESTAALKLEEQLLRPTVSRRTI